MALAIDVVLATLVSTDHTASETMENWTPRRKEGLQDSGLVLTPEEGLLLSRLDGATSMTDLAVLTGETLEALGPVSAGLVARGAICADDVPIALLESSAPTDTVGDDPGDDPAIDLPRHLDELPEGVRPLSESSRAAYQLLVRNRAQWPPTPPALLRFLARHQMVRRNAGLRNRLLKHPNCPSDAKRD